jgi:hypothetical protein
MNEKADEASRPDPRDLDSIFNALRALAQSDGALHEPSSLYYRDWVVAIDVEEGTVANDPEKRWSTTKLNNNEFMLLMGLMVQSTSDRTHVVVVLDNDFESRADALLREFHDRLIADARPILEDPSDIERKLGVAAREAIYYGADSFYLHQLARFGRDRYRADLTNSLLIAKSELAEKFGSNKADAFVTKFATPVAGANLGFTGPFVVNQANLAPLIDLGEHLYAPNTYRLFESIYESPFYWMIANDDYRNTAAEHRGAFVERTAADLLRRVFGADNVHENVTIQPSKKRTAGEADVLVAYGEFVIICQAKSKRVTLKARAGDEEALATARLVATVRKLLERPDCLGERQLSGNRRGVLYDRKGGAKPPLTAQRGGDPLTAAPRRYRPLTLLLLRPRRPPTRSGYRPPIVFPSTVALRLRAPRSRAGRAA